MHSRRYAFVLIGAGAVSLVSLTVFCEIDRQVTRLSIQLADEQTVIFDEMREKVASADPSKAVDTCLTH